MLGVPAALVGELQGLRITPPMRLAGCRAGAAGVLGRDQQVPAAIFLEAGLVLLFAEGALLPVGDRLHARRGDSQARQVLPHRGGAAVAEREVVFLRPALVAVPFDRAAGWKGTSSASRRRR